MTSRNLQLFAWHRDRRFLFIATTGGAYDLVKDQPVSDQTLARLQEEFQHLCDNVDRQRKWTTNALDNAAPSAVTTGVRNLGSLVGRIILHPDIRRLLSEQEFSEITISTNQFAIPWELLQIGETFMGLKCPVTRRVQSPRPFQSETRIVFRARLKVLIASNPTEDLPATEVESSKIKQVLSNAAERFEVCTLNGKFCTRFELLGLISEADIFHYAGHAYFDADRPEQSGLLLSDGPLLASELENYLDRTGPLLVFLSACESSAFAGADRLTGSEQMASLAHPFIAAGCSAFIGSSLPVGDIQAAHFATTIYDELSQGETLAKSTFKARKSVANRFGIEDTTWSSFLLFGDGDLRAVLTPDQIPVTRDSIYRAVRTAVEWLRSERQETGFWCDRVYRHQAPYNSAEVALAFAAAGVEMNIDERASTIQSILGARDLDYSAAPYEPAAVGKFTSCVSYVLQALQLFLDDSSEEAVRSAAKDAMGQLLAMQCPSGGWSWGASGATETPYTLFTTEALDALLGVETTPEVDAALRRGFEYLVGAQREDGGWTYREDVPESDPSSTCYALCALFSQKDPLSSPIVERSVSFLRNRLDFLQLTDSQFFVDHRIEVVGTPRNSWPHYEDYSGIAALCQLLILRPELESMLSTSGFRERLLTYLLNNQEYGRGWPKVYSTIYATNYYINVLSAAANVMPE